MTSKGTLGYAVYSQCPTNDSYNICKYSSCWPCNYGTKPFTIIVELPPPLPCLYYWGGWPSKNWVTWGGRGWVQKFLLDMGDIPEKGGWCKNGGVATFFIIYSSVQSHLLCVGESKVSFITFQVFSLLSLPCKILIQVSVKIFIHVLIQVFY